MTQFKTIVSRVIVTAVLAALFTVVSATDMRGNNIAVTSVSLTGQNTTSDFTLVQFSVSWDNSWRIANGAANWDAAWVFVKFRVGASDPIFDGVSSSGTTVTVSSTANLRVGMPVRVVSGTGAFASNSVISSITNSTQFVVSASPTTPLSGATVECIRIWEHARLNNTGHTAPAGSTIDAGMQVPGDAFNATTNPALGVFIYRNANGAGSNTFSSAQLQWNYGANNVSDDAFVRVRVFAVEMVRVPGGVDFNVGGGGGTSAFTSTTINTGTATTVPAGVGTLGGQAGGYPTGQVVPANATWPNGYNAFYCMKYEVSQGQYRDFLNTLTYQQQATRTANAPNSAAGTAALSNTNRNGLDIMTPGSSTTLQPAVYACNLDGDAVYNETVDGEWIACNHLTWTHGCAYMDWAGLRPMTELEYEKACRGNLAAVANEYAWGTIVITAANNITNGGATNETTNTANANAVYNTQVNVTGPMRSGVFAGAATNREQAGATYYGIMEMSGNLWERIVNISTVAGRSYTGIHGNGSLLRDGSADVDFWPGVNGNANAGLANAAFAGTTGITQNAGSGLRSGSWNDPAGDLLVSDRGYVGFVNEAFANEYGFRGVRNSP